MSLKKVAYKFNPEDLTGLKIPKDASKETREQIAQAVHEFILDYVGQGKTPVAGGSWKRTLSKEYLKIKKEESGVSFANMELTGDMLDALEVVVSGKNIEVRIQGEEAGKADGHNNFSGDSKLPTRSFIPNAGKNQTFKRPIIDEMKNIIRDMSDGND